MPQRSAARRPSGWSTPLSEPIRLSNGATLMTLGDAGRFIGDHPENRPRLGWNEAASGLLIAADKPTPENVKTATDRTHSAMYFARLLRVS